MNFTATTRPLLLLLLPSPHTHTLPSWSSSASTKKSGAGCGLIGSSRSGRRSGISGAPRNRSWTTRWSCRRLTFLCRRGRTSWWRCASTWTCRSPNRLLMCPRSHLHPVVLAGAGFPWCRRRNSWWKCLLSYPFLLCTVPHGRGLQGSLPGQTSTTSSSHSLGVADEAFTWFFALFPKF